MPSAIRFKEVRNQNNWSIQHSKESGNGNITRNLILRRREMPCEGCQSSTRDTRPTQANHQ